MGGFEEKYATILQSADFRQTETFSFNAVQNRHFSALKIPLYKRKKDRCGSVLLPFSLRGILRRVEHVSKKGAVPFLLNTLILYRGFKKSC